ncbi:MAG: L,D-transpeptidase family protein [Actinobacteria bacterium]|nr:L,D-transpeptidase family protein [Actinomycetota bacterium]
MRKALLFSIFAALWAPPATAACPPTIANQISAAADRTQLVTVVVPRRTSTRAQLRLWRKAGECWVPLADPWAAWVGGRGVSLSKREGDRRTPGGAFGFERTMYGVAPNPGVRYRYHRVVCGDWWVEDSRSPFYNRFRHVRCGSSPPFRTMSEDLSKSPTAYRHFAVIDYNTEPTVPGRGSGIFLHVSTGRPTLGCVSLPLPQLLRLLRWLRPASLPMIAIGTRSDLLAL